jgi:AcrR family transcriptional regulator
VSTRTAEAGTKSERTRERVISAAASTLSRLGYSGTRLADVAEEAGLQAPAIYYYFSSRDQLIEEVVVVGTIKLRDFVAAALDRAPTTATALERIDVAVEAHIRQLMSESGFAHAVIRNVGQLPPAIRGRQVIEERKYAEMWRALFGEAHADGSMRAELDPELARLLVIGSLNWATEWWTPQRGSLDAVVATAQSIVRHGIEAPAQRNPTRRNHA